MSCIVPWREWLGLCFARRVFCQQQTAHVHVKQWLCGLGYCNIVSYNTFQSLSFLVTSRIYSFYRDMNIYIYSCKSWRWRQYILPKRQHKAKILHSPTTQKTAVYTGLQVVCSVGSFLPHLSPIALQSRPYHQMQFRKHKQIAQTRKFSPTQLRLINDGDITHSVQNGEDQNTATKQICYLFLWAWMWSLTLKKRIN
jgi:hypothetical protein